MKTYVFHFSLPGTGRVWRKAELRADQTLTDLHFTIMRAYEWGGDHLYSFFMSGKAWDGSTEYCLPEGVPPDSGPIEVEEKEGAEVEIEPEKLRDILDLEFKLDAEGQLTQPINLTINEEDKESLLEELGLLKILEGIPGLSADTQKKLKEEMKPFLMDLFDEFLQSEYLTEELLFYRRRPEPGDARKTKLEDLELEEGKEFMYLFDYGDEHRFKVRVHEIHEDAPEDVDYPRIVESVGEAPPQYPHW